MRYNNYYRTNRWIIGAKVCCQLDQLILTARKYGGEPLTNHHLGFWIFLQCDRAFSFECVRIYACVHCSFFFDIIVPLFLARVQLLNLDYDRLVDSRHVIGTNSPTIVIRQAFEYRLWIDERKRKGKKSPLVTPLYIFKLFSWIEA